ncbi:hypothetical protein [Croceivirga radicis]|uniref:hypothetical protein n=1 Tax=Croceivirga radicis TaxID=1929488 RepID=UPI000255B324|nr:hypothetical protein [Croceivirga radicis]
MGIIFPLITGLLLLYADFQSGKKLKKNVHGQFHLRLNKSYKWIGIVCCLIGSFLLNAAISHWNEEIAFFAPFAVLIFFVMGIVILVWYYNYQLVFDDRRIISTNWMRKKRIIEWSDIENIKFNTKSGYLKLYTKLEKIIILQHSTGFIEFLKLMELKTKFRAEELRIPLKI